MKLKANDFKPYLRVLDYCRAYTGRILSALACMTLSSAFGVVPPWLVRNMIDDVLNEGNGTALNLIAAGMIALYVLKALFAYGYMYLSAWVGQKAIMAIRLELYDKTQRLSLRVLYKRRTGEFLSRITNDVSTLQNIISSIVVDLVIQSFYFIGFLGFLFYINWKLTLVTFLVIPPAAFVIDRASAKLRGIGGDVQEQLAQLAAIAQEALSSVRIVRSFATEDIETGRFDAQSGKHFKSIMKGTQTRGVLEGFVEVALFIAMAPILWLGGRDVLAGNLTTGELVAFLIYLGLLVQPVRTISRAVSSIQQGAASADRIFEILDEQDEVVLPARPVIPRNLGGSVAFEDVWFAYEGERWVLSGFNLVIKPGEKVAIVGPTGTGKSTLGDLLLRFYDPSRGRILVGGTDLRELDLKSYRRKVGVVPQDPALMKGSLAYNISYGCDASGEAIKKAAAMAGIDEFISSLPNGYDTEVGERGVTLSGGQRQRVAIARAIVREPVILLMDEATSSLDALVESQIQGAMNVAMAGRTSLVIAHRLSTIREADRIVVLGEGRVAEEGTHDELIAKRGLYFELYSLQSGESDTLREAPRKGESVRD
ncbi:MAG: ABC transporter ATP-binding protein/permease [Synergistaceae bacterium]|nr:ABC transporter ATP-binding protein/permease [Synergistaceae bacterium]